MAITGSPENNIVKEEIIIFLDIDGTLIPTLFSKFMEMMKSASQESSSRDKFGEHFYPDCLKNLKTLVDKTDAKIVFTTNWRDQGLDRLKSLWFERTNFGEVLDMTPILENNRRGDEIDAWLEKNKGIKKYVIIDDMGNKFFNKHQLSHLVKCDETIGFSASDLKKALQILK